MSQVCQWQKINPPRRAAPRRAGAGALCRTPPCAPLTPRARAHAHTRARKATVALCRTPPRAPLTPRARARAHAHTRARKATVARRRSGGAPKRLHPADVIAELSARVAEEGARVEALLASQAGLARKAAALSLAVEQYNALMGLSAHLGCAVPLAPPTLAGEPSIAAAAATAAAAAAAGSSWSSQSGGGAADSSDCDGPPRRGPAGEGPGGGGAAPRGSHSHPRSGAPECSTATSGAVSAAPPQPPPAPPPAPRALGPPARAGAPGAEGSPVAEWWRLACSGALAGAGPGGGPAARAAAALRAVAEGCGGADGFRETTRREVQRLSCLLL
jgi:hypothetical protein